MLAQGSAAGIQAKQISGIKQVNDQVTLCPSTACVLSRALHVEEIKKLIQSLLLRIRSTRSHAQTMITRRSTPVRNHWIRLGSTDLRIGSCKQSGLMEQDADALCWGRRRRGRARRGRATRGRATRTRIRIRRRATRRRNRKKRGRATRTRIRIRRTRATRTRIRIRRTTTRRRAREKRTNAALSQRKMLVSRAAIACGMSVTVSCHQLVPEKGTALKSLKRLGKAKALKNQKRRKKGQRQK